MKKVLKIFLIIVAILAVVIIAFAFYLNQGQKEVLNMQINDVNFANYADGTYQGTYEGYRWTNTVAVTIKDQKVTSIEVLKPQTFRLATVEDTISDEVIVNQSLKVDTVSGGTISSKAMLKAIENAFNK